jgi:YD repeat-containing protein
VARSEPTLLYESIDGGQISTTELPRSLVWTWDAKDIFGRPISGTRPVDVELSYYYPCEYTASARFASFGDGTTLVNRSSADPRVAAARGPCRVALKRDFTSMIGATDVADIVGLGGWDVSTHHSVSGGMLLRGDGGRTEVEPGGFTELLVANANGPSAPRTFAWPSIAAHDDGDFYFATPHGIHHVEGGRAPVLISSGPQPTSRSEDPEDKRDGMLVSDYPFTTIWDLALSPSGELHVVEASEHFSRVVRITKDRRVYAVTGKDANGIPGFQGDGGPAINARTRQLRGLTFDRDGALYIADDANEVIWRVDPSGIIRRIAGVAPGTEAGLRTGQAASDARTVLLSLNASDLSFGPDGTLYLNETDGVRAIRPNGSTQLVYRHAGGSSDSAFTALAVARDGSLLLGNGGTNSVSRGRFNASGMLELTSALGVPRSSSAQGCGPTGGLPARQLLGKPESIAVDAHGYAYVSMRCGSQPTRIILFHEGSPLQVASEDGSEVFEFDSRGRHENTRSALTGARLREFSYDAEGRLERVTECTTAPTLQDSCTGERTTTIQRNGSNISIVAPYGQVTTIGLDANGYASSIRPDPDSPAYKLTHGADGLLSHVEDPRGSSHTYRYDMRGRIEHDIDHLNHDVRFIGYGDPDTYTVEMRSPEDRITKYTSNLNPDGSVAHRVTFPDLRVNETRTSRDGVTSTTYWDGTRVTTTVASDPALGAAASSPSSVLLRLPSGVTRTLTRAMTATLSNQRDKASVVSRVETLTDTTSAGLRIQTSQYVRDPATSTGTWTSSVAQGGVTIAGPKVTLDALGRSVGFAAPGHPAYSLTYNLGRVNNFTAKERVGVCSTNSTQSCVSDAECAGGSCSFDARTVTWDFDPATGFAQRMNLPVPNARTVYGQRDAMGRPTQINQTRRPDNLDALVTTRVRYDEEGHLRFVTPSGKGEHELRYSAVDTYQSYLAPDATTLNGNIKDVSSAALSPDRDSRTYTLADGRTVRYQYHAQTGKLDRVTTTDSPFSETWVFTEEAADWAMPLRREIVKSSVSGDSVTDYFDGSLLRETRWYAGTEWIGSVSRTYDAALRISTMAVSGDAPVTYGYDASDRVVRAGDMKMVRYRTTGQESDRGQVRFTQIVQSAGTKSIASEFAYGTFGEVASQRVGVRDATTDLTESSTLTLSTELYREEISLRDEAGRIKQRSETINGVTKNYAYSYNLLGQLTDVSDATSAVHYEYDDNGNRSQRRVNGTLAEAGQYDLQDRVTSYGGVTYSFGTAGRSAGYLKSKTQGGITTNYAYDAPEAICARSKLAPHALLIRSTHATGVWPSW